MLRSVRGIRGFTLQATDGNIGRAKDFLFDDDQWTVRYMVADTGRWFPGRRVLIAPASLGPPDWVSRQFPVRLTKQQIEDAPALEEDAPVGKRYEAEHRGCHAWPYYWGEPETWWGLGASPANLYAPQSSSSETVESSGDPHLRSAHEVTGYRAVASDGEIGHIDDFLLDDQVWGVRCIVVSTGNWLPGKRVLISPSQVESIEWGNEEAHIGLSEEAVKSSPEYDPSLPVNPEHEPRLYDILRRPR